MLTCWYTFQSGQYKVFNSTNGKWITLPENDLGFYYPEGYHDRILGELINYLITGELTEELTRIKEGLI